jgi:high-affinity nickel-transport protein
MKLFQNPFQDGAERLLPQIVTLQILLLAGNLAAWAWAWTLFSDRPALLGTAFLAYVLGLRHAVDPDHIAAIDNVVRKLMEDGKKPLSVGFFFSLGHSTIVVLASMALALFAGAMQPRFDRLHDAGAIIGVTISAAFLIVIGLANLVILFGLWRRYRAMRTSSLPQSIELDGLVGPTGIFSHLFRPLFRRIGRSWHIYPIGFLFGLGFDTASEIGLLGISASQGAQGLDFWSIMVFPALFTAGMTLVDTNDSIFMVGAYGWAFADPARKLRYNMTMTAASVIVALLIGGLEALGLIGDKLGLGGGFWRMVAGLNQNLSHLGLLMIGLFAMSWLVALAVYRWRVKLS